MTESRALMSGRDHMDRCRPGSSQRPWRFLFPILALGFACRVGVVLGGDFIYHPDVVLSYLEPAWRLASGYGLVNWEQYYGARSQLIPGVLAVVMDLLLKLGIQHPVSLRTGVEVVLCGVSLLVPWGMYALARAVLDERAARVALVLGVAWWELVALAGQALSEMLALGPLVWTFAVAADARSGRRATALAVLLIATCALRFQYAPLALVAVALAWPGLAASGARVRFLASAAVCLVLLAIFDMATVGAPLYRSYVANLVFNLVFVEEIVAVGVATPWVAYPLALFLASGGLFAVGVTGVLLVESSKATRITHAKWLLLPIAILVALHVASPWKEYRFILASVPFWLTAFATVLTALWPRGTIGRRVAVALALWFLAASALGLLARLPGQDGLYASFQMASREFVGPPDPRLELARRLVDDATLAGLAEIATDPGTGLGQVHLGRNVPIFDGHSVAALEECGIGPSAYATHAIVPPDAPLPDGFPVRLADARGWRLVATGRPNSSTPAWLSQFPVSLTGFWGRIARRVFEPESLPELELVELNPWAIRLWEAWLGGEPGPRPLVALRVPRPGLPLRVALPAECTDSLRPGDRATGRRGGRDGSATAC